MSVSRTTPGKIDEASAQQSFFLSSIGIDDLAAAVAKLLKADIQPPPVSDNTEIVDTKTLCDRLAISEPTAISMRKKKTIPFLRVGTAIRYDWQKVIKALEKKGV